MERKLTPSPFVPFDPNVYLYVTSEGGAGVPPGAGGVHPFEYTGWWDEMLSYHDNCYIHAGLNPAAVYRISGKDSVEFFKKYFTNSFEKFEIGAGKHGIMCNKDGKIVKDGVILRTAEEEYMTYWLWPPVEYVLEKSGLDVQGENLSGQIFMYQLAGPKSLDIVEKAANEDIRDIKFFRFRNAKIAGKDISILRIGMAGSLAYEIHGKIEDAVTVYNALLEAGREFGIRRLGRHGYRNTHTEGGFPQQSIHFTSAIYDDEYPAFFAERTWGGAPITFAGSTGDERELHTRNPIELGWGKTVKFDHDFVGRAALEKEAENPSSRPMTLIWNHEDIMDVWKSVFEPGEPCKLMDLCEDLNPQIGSSEIHSDQVLLDGKVIGMSSGRMFSPKNREMISLGAIKPEYYEEGKEVMIAWGDPDKRQKMIRARMESWPYFSENRNENIDVSKLK